MEFDPRDASVGEQIAYGLSIGAEETGEVPRIRREELSISKDGPSIDLITTEEGIRKRRVRAAGQDEVKPVRKSRRKTPRPPVADGETTRWLAFDDPDRLALSAFDQIESRGADLLADYLKRAVFLRLNPRAIADFVPPKRSPSPRILDEQGLEVAHLLAKLNSELLQVLVEKLSYIIQGASSLETHNPTGPGDRRYFEFIEPAEGHEQLARVPAWVLSEGTRRITAILAVLLQDPPPPLVCIEELENGFDPWTLKYLLNELDGAVMGGTQVIFTSHSPYLLNLIPVGNVVYCERKDKGAFFSDAAKLQPAALQEWMGAGDLYANRYFSRRDRDPEK
jgi:hypothetical protein